MTFFSDNCVRVIKVPTGNINRFDYSSELNLVASSEFASSSATVWNPDTGEIVKEIELMECHADILFLAGQYIGVPWDEANHGSGLAIYDIDSGEQVLDIIECYDGQCITAAMTPHKSLVIGGSGLTEFSLDFEKKKMIEKKRICDTDDNVCYMCCSKDSYTICYCILYEGTLKCLDVLEFASEIKDSESYSESDATKAVTTEETIEDCFINGEEHGLCVRSLVHDGEYIIVAGDDEIIALESATEGSVGHVIVSSGIPDDQDLATGQIRLNDKGQLMVCDGSDVIKVYEYKGLNTLQGLCRRQINRILKHRKDKVEDLPIPSNIKKFLLYK